MNNIITNDLGKAFPPAMSFAGLVFAIAGTISLFSSLWMGLLLSVSGIFIAFTRNGVQLDLQNKTYRLYTGIFGLKTGNWRKLEKYKNICILRNKVETAAYSRSYRRALTSSQLFYEITLLDDTHRIKLCVERLNNKNDALTSLNHLAERFDLKIVQYKPQKIYFKKT